MLKDWDCGHRIVACGLVCVSLAASSRAGERDRPDDADLHHVTQVTDRVAWAFGRQGTALKTTDGGRTWQPVELPVAIDGTAACFLTSNVGWVAGHVDTGDPKACRLLSTTDGGKTWKVGEVPYRRIATIRFFDLDNGIIGGCGVGEHARGVSKTSDGGRTWTSLPGGEVASWRAAAFTSQNEGLLGGPGLRLGDVRNGSLVVVQPGDSGRRFWNAAAEDAAGGAWVVGDGAAILRRRVGRTTWQPPRTPLPSALSDAMDFRCVAATGEQVWVAGQPGSVVWHSRDGGQHWERQGTTQTLPLYGISMRASGVGIAVGALGVVVRTSDKGKHWEVVRGSGRRLALLSLQVRPASLAWGLMASECLDEGYRGRAFAFAGEHSEAADVGLAAGRIGVNGVQVGWRLNLGVPDLVRDARRLTAQWSNDTEGRLSEFLVAHVITQIRMWRPSVLVLPAADGGDHAAAMINKAVTDAVSQASDATRGSVRAALLGLQPWSVKRVYEQTAKEGSADVEIDGARVMRAGHEPLFAVVARATSTARSTMGVRWRHDRLRHISGSATSRSDSVCAGLGISQGSAARRRFHLGDIDERRDGRNKAKWRALHSALRDASGPPERMVAHLPRLIAGLSDTKAGWAVWGLAKRMREDGLPHASEELLAQLLSRWPRHPAAGQAAELLLGQAVSAERQWQRARRSRLNDSVTAPAVFRPHSEAGHSTGTPAIHRAVSRDLRDVRAVPWRDLLSQESLEASIRWARVLRSQASASYLSPETQLTLAALFRARRAGRLSDSCIRRVAGTPGPWRVIAQQELWLGSRVGPPPTYSVRCDVKASRPILDGVLSDRCWELAAEMRLKTVGRSVPDGPTGFLLVTSDSEYLYIGGSLPHLPRGAADHEQQQPMWPTARQHDANHVGHDRVSVFLDVDRDYQLGYELTIDERGQVSESCAGSTQWNPRCHLAVEADRASWRFELALPWTEVAPAAPAPGTIWACRVVRTIPALGWQSWGGRRDTNGAPSLGAGLLWFATLKP